MPTPNTFFSPPGLLWLDFDNADTKLSVGAQYCLKSDHFAIMTLDINVFK